MKSEITTRAGWYLVHNADEIPSPALLVYPDRVEENVRRMIAMAGDVGRLCPHMKTHKMPEVILLQMAAGITRFKCATIAEAEMVAQNGASHVLLAIQPVGPNIGRLLQLVDCYPRTHFAAVVDDSNVVDELSRQFSAAESTVSLLLDLDCGMHRSGMLPGPEACELYRRIAQSPGLDPGGLHVYDGHIREADFAKRQLQCQEGFRPVVALRNDLLKAQLPVPRVVVGGTPTFPVHAQNPHMECSPGTCLLWDAGYGERFADLPFLHAAVVLTRVVSKPASNRLCLDLGHKAIASENPPPRVRFLDLPDARAVGHSEEHLLIETERAGDFAVGDSLYGIPYHICPTCALYGEAMVIESGRAVARWKIVARERCLTI